MGRMEERKEGRKEREEENPRVPESAFFYVWMLM